MARGGPSPAVSVERFFQFALLGLVASGYLAVAGSGYLDSPTVVLTGAGLLLRGLLICGVVKLDISERASGFIALAYTAFYALDYFVLSRDFLTATVHLVFFLAVLKIFTARNGRDYLYTAAIAFLELVAAAVLSVNFNFFLFLALYLLFAIAALTSGEIRRSMQRAASPARGTLRRFHARLAGLAVMVTVGTLILTGGLFFLLPRTAEAAFERLVPHRVHVPGFSNLVNLENTGGEIQTSSRAVMHIQIFNREPWNIRLQWRGGALTFFDGKHWINPDKTANAIPIGKDGYVVLGTARPGQLGLNYHVEMEPLDTDALFLAGTPLRVDLHRRFLIRTGVDSYRLDHPSLQGIRYDAYSAIEAPPSGAPAFAAADLTAADRETNLQLPTLDPRIPQLARLMSGGAATPLERARAIESALHSHYRYTLQLPDREERDPLAYFLFTRKQGHCEYFASAMAVMLRTIGIPARIATGFSSGVYNSLTELWLVRASDAHAWVEAWLPAYGWTSFDPTPSDPSPAHFNLSMVLGLYLDAAETFWQDWVVSYDLGRQDALVDRIEQNARGAGIRWFDAFSLGGLGGRVSAWLHAYGVRAAVVIGMALWLWFLMPPLVRLMRMRRRVRNARLGQASMLDATLLYQRMLHVLKRHGYQKPPWFTPVEFAGSLPEGDLSAAVLEFTRAYNALRFGGRAEAAPQLSSLLDNLQRQPVARR